jgi:hypothetical protein
MNGLATRAGARIPHAGDRYGSDVILLWHGEGTNGGTTITDSSLFNHNPPTTQIAVTTSTTQFKYGLASAAFNAGSGSFAEYTATSEWLDGTKDWTKEGWIYPTAVDATRRSIFDFRFDGSGSGTAFAMDFIAGALRFEIGVGSSLFSITGTAPTVNTWQHVAFVRDGNSLRYYLNGVQQASRSDLAGGSMNDKSATAKVRIGRRNDGAQNYDGWMDEVRFTRNICRYPGGTTFTPPSGPFPNP